MDYASLSTIMEIPPTPTEQAVRILYIEDDAGLARLAQRRLERLAGFSVATAASGEEGMQALAGDTPEAVVIDYILPDMNGLDVLKIIEQQYPSVVAIMVTGAGDESIAVEAMKHHAMDYIVKDAAGIYLDRLSERIKRLVEFQRLKIKQQASDREIRSLSTAVSQSGDAIIMFDVLGVAVYANDAFEKITGYVIQDIIGSNPLGGSGRSWPLAHEIWRKIISTPVFDRKIVERRKDGGQFPAIIAASPILGEDGNIERHLVSLKDMTEYETLLTEFNQAQKLDAIGTLVGGIAHDFNNTLAAISGNLYLAKKQAAALPGVVNKITAVEDLCSHACGMIQQLLTFARKSMTDMKPVTISTFLKEIIKIHRIAVPENIALTHDISNSEMKIKGDISLLQQVIMNLINNARDAVADVHESYIKISLERFSSNEHFCNRYPELQAGDYACISVADNGSGIKKSDLEHIFEPFFTTKAVGKGTGLGLAMSFGAIQTHGGVIQVESRLGEGTVFRIYLPLVESALTSITTSLNDELVSGRGECILLADDNQSILKSTAAVLESLGYQVLTAEDGAEAVDIYRKRIGTIDLSILDVVMPHMGGVEVAEIIRSLHSEARIIFSTGYDRDNVLQGNAQVVDVSVLSKPFSMHALSHAIRRCLDQ
jgi:PAS domain S-box-containing protein